MNDQPLRLDAQQPMNDEAERAVLGACLIDSGASRRLPGLTPAHFWDKRHAEIWTAIRAAEAEGQVDYVTVSRRLNGLQAYTVGLANSTPNAYHASEYADLVIGAARCRAWLQDASSLAKAAYAGDEAQALGAIEAARQRMQDVGREQTEQAATVAGRLWDVLNDPDGMARLAQPTGIAALDDALGGGPEAGTQTILMARPSVGKTALLVQISDLTSAAGRRVIVLTKEHTADSWMRRMAFRRARANWLRYKQGKLDREKQVEVFTHLQTLGARSTLAFEGGAQTSIQAMDACRRVADRWGGLDFILADHLRLFADRDDREVRRLGKISANLREIARELGARNITAAQLSRTVESQADKRPDLKDLRDSGEIEENADNVIALYRKAYYQNGEATSDEAELWIRKARDGERDAKVVLVFLKEWMSFEPKAWLDTITEVPHVREYVN